MTEPSKKTPKADPQVTMDTTDTENAEASTPSSKQGPDINPKEVTTATHNTTKLTHSNTPAKNKSQRKRQPVRASTNNHHRHRGLRINQTKKGKNPTSAPTRTKIRVENQDQLAQTPRANNAKLARLPTPTPYTETQESFSLGQDYRQRS